MKFLARPVRMSRITTPVPPPRILELPMARWTVILEDDPETGAVTVRLDPPISKADLANHIAQLKVNGRGYGPAFDYACYVRTAIIQRSKGLGARERDKAKDGRLILLPS